MIGALVVGLVGGCGLLVAVRGLFARPRIEDRFAALGLLPRPGAHAGRSQRRDQDLRIAGRDHARLAVERIAGGLAGLAVPAVSAGLATAGGVAVPYGLALVAGLVLGAGGVVLPDLLLRSAAAARRRSFVHGLSAYLDLVGVLLAGAAGTETALVAAAASGDNWVFVEIRRALARAHTLQRSPWDALDELGDAIGVRELVELAASVRLAGVHGARIRSTLATRADALRRRRLDDAERAATAATEQMALPNVALFLGFLVLVGYPAIASILAGD